MSNAKKSITSSDELNARHEPPPQERGQAIEPPSTTQKIVRDVTSNRFFYTLIVGGLLWYGGQLWGVRDQALVQPYVDKEQTKEINDLGKRVDKMGEKVHGMDKKVDALLFHFNIDPE